MTKIINETKFSNKKIDVLNIDAEGHDYEVLIGLDLKKYSPKIICIEISPLVDEKNKDYKNTEIFKFLSKNNYELIWRGFNSFMFLLNK